MAVSATKIIEESVAQSGAASVNDNQEPLL
jgi:hypothetical protein